MKNLAVTILMASIVVYFGCSSSNTPVTNPNHPANPDEITHVAIVNNGDSYATPLGVYEGFIDTQNLTAELIPVRNGSVIGDVFDVDITQFLTANILCPFFQ